MDINEVFDNLMLAEDIAEQSGYEEGYQAGKEKQTEGFHLGYHRASVLGAQLGYYKGILLLFKSHPKEKCALLAEEIIKEIDQFPKDNDENTDLKAALESIKCKFQKFCFMVKISSTYPESDKLEF